MSDVFIAHVEEDADVALEIALSLEEAGYTTWCYEVDSIPGPSYLIQTGRAVEQAKAVVLVISPHSVGSRQVTKEVVRAHESGKEFIPVLRDITHIEFQNRQPEWREAVGAAASIRIPQEGVAGILPRITTGLKALGINPMSETDAARIAQIRRALAELQGHSITEKAVEMPAPTKKPKPEPVAVGLPSAKTAQEARRPKRWGRPALIASGLVAIIALSIVGMTLFGRSGNVPPNPPGRPSAAPATPAAAPTPAPPPALTPAPTSAASISGYVYDVRGQPIIGASVDAFVYETGQKGWYAETDGSGHYQIRGMPAGNYKVMARAPKYVPKYWKNTLWDDKATPVSVTAPNDTPNINFSLELGGLISGTVKDKATGQTLANVSVDAGRADGEGGGGATTDQNGSYTITGLPFGKYKVSSPSSKHWGSGDGNYATQYYTEPVSLSLQNPRASQIDFSIGAGGSISGRVTDEVGNPIANADVWADYWAGGNAGGVPTDAQGYYTIKGLPGGDYRVQAKASGRVQKVYNNTLSYQQATPVLVTAPNDTAKINFSLEPGGTISGTVKDKATGQTLANVSVDAGRADGEGGGGAITDQDGNYTITGLPFGKYKVSSPSSKHWGSGDGNYATQYYTEPVSLSLQNPRASQIDFSIGAGGSISGRVTDEVGNPIANADVWADYWAGGNAGGVPTDAQGYYTIKGLPGGDYRVQAKASGRVQKVYNNTLSYQQATPVLVTAPNDTAKINFSLEPGGTISGTVKDKATGQTLANVSMDAGRADGDGGGGAATDQNGNYTITGLPFGQYKVSSPSGGKRGSGDGNYATQYYNNKADWGSADLVTVSSQRPNAMGINFALGAGGSISGRVSDEAGNPIANADIWADYWAGGTAGGVRVDAQGYYTIKGLPGGDYRVQAKASGRVQKVYINTLSYQQATPVSVTAPNDTPNINFSLASGGTISGRVYQSDGATPIPNLDMTAQDYNTNMWIAGTRTNQDGSYSLIVPSGTYRVMAHSSRPYAGEYYNNTYNFNEAKPIPVTAPRNVPNIDFILQAGGTISGHVYKADGITPIPNLHVNASDYSTNSWLDGTNTGQDGSYTLVVPAGRYRVRACASAGSGLPYADEYYNDTYDYNQAYPVLVAVGQIIPNINFCLASGGTISGKVTDQNQQPIANLHVYAEDFNTGQWISGTNTNSDGSYTLAGLPAGNYRVGACASCSKLPYTDKWYNNALNSNNATSVRVSAPNNTPGINFTLN